MLPDAVIVPEVARLPPVMLPDADISASARFDSPDIVVLTESIKIDPVWMLPENIAVFAALILKDWLPLTPIMTELFALVLPA